MVLSIASALLLALATAPSTLAHNFVTCSNAFPNITGLTADIPRGDIIEMQGQCKGAPRAMPAKGTPEDKLYGDQGWPWQGIWPLQDGAALRNHRVCNWLAENPVYDPANPPAKVKPKSSVLVQIATNNHAHEYAQRKSGRHMIFLAGKSGTQLTTANQLTFDRVVASAPANKYAHIQGTPNFAGYGGDPGSSWMPLKLVDPSGNWLPEGTYSFVFAWFWSTDGSNGPSIDYMIPSYSSCFDIIISNDATDSGAITDCVNNRADCANYLKGASGSPGAKDDVNPWPPYPPNYLQTNYDGDDPASENGKRTFQPYWTKHVEASAAPAISTKKTPAVRSLGDDDFLTSPIPIAGGNVEFPTESKSYPSMPAGAGSGLAITNDAKPLVLGSGGSVVGSVNAGTMGGGSFDNSTTVASSSTTATTTKKEAVAVMPKASATVSPVIAAAAASTQTAGYTSQADGEGNDTADADTSADADGEEAGDDDCDLDENDPEMSIRRRHPRDVSGPE